MLSKYNNYFRNSKICKQGAGKDPSRDFSGSEGVESVLFPEGNPREGNPLFTPKDLKNSYEGNFHPVFIIFSVANAVFHYEGVGKLARV